MKAAKLLLCTWFIAFYIISHAKNGIFWVRVDATTWPELPNSLASSSQDDEGYGATRRCLCP